MAAWLAPAFKAVLPHLGTIVSAVAPVFTRKKAEATANLQLLQEQIAELQSAASQSTEYIKDLAAQLQTTIAALEQAAWIAEEKIRWALWLSVVAIIFAAVNLALLLFIVFTR